MAEKKITISNKLITDLSNEPFLSDWKFIKSRKTFRKEFKGGYWQIEVRNPNYYPYIRMGIYLEVYFYKIMDWFIKYLPDSNYIKKISPVKLMIIYDYLDLYIGNNTLFNIDFSDYDEKYTLFQKRFENIVNNHLCKITNLYDVYNLLIRPTIVGNEHPKWNTDSFHNLIAKLMVCHYFDKKNYKYLKDRVISQLSVSHDQNWYYKHIDNIFHDLESLEIGDDYLPKPNSYATR